VIYLDASATTRPSPGVIQALSGALQEDWFNPSALYLPALNAHRRMEECRETILKALSAREHRVIFTPGGTYSNNLAFFGSLRQDRSRVRAAVTSVEHPSVLSCAQRLETEGAKVIYLPVNALGSVELDAVKSALKEGLDLLSVMQVNNETGAVNPVSEIVKLRDELCPSCLLHVDGVQGFLRENMSLKGVDMYTLSAHKIHALKGTGALLVSGRVHLKPLIYGGGQEGGLMSGTENTPGIIALNAAVNEMLADTGMHERMRALKDLLKDGITRLTPWAKVNSPENGAAHILNISFPGVNSETLLHALEEDGIYVGNGSACSARGRKGSKVLLAMGLGDRIAQSALRFSLSRFTAEEEIMFTARKVADKAEMLVKYQRR
jgi:Cysteine sulfinate desulfinase/cysteine desulfurase and related enzymes